MTTFSESVAAVYADLARAPAFVPSLSDKHGREFNTCLHLLQVNDDALEAYLTRAGDPHPHLADLEAYGVFQTLFAQQDAMKVLWSAVGAGEYASDPGLAKIRGLRNTAVGHPAERLG